MQGFQTSGSLQFWQMSDNRLFVQYEHASLELHRSHEYAISVRIRTIDRDSDHVSYAVIRDLNLPWMEVIEGVDSLRLLTETCYLEISKKQLLVNTYTLNGDPILEDHETLGTMWKAGSVWICKKKRENERILGLGEKTGPLDKSGKIYTHWNHDNFAYGEDSDPLYASFPFYYGVNESNVYGLFVDQAQRSIFDFGTSNEEASILKIDNDSVCYHLYYSGDMRGILRAYADMTGYAPLPPIWSLGYQQCRYSYYPQEEVIALAETFRRKEIPADVIYLDIHYMEAFKVFTWNKELFNDWKKMIEEIHKLGFRLVVILDPGVKAEEDYAVYNELIALGAYIRWPDGKPYVGRVWPGKCIFPDFSNPAARAWWANRVSELREAGVDGFWNDMNEPAVFGNAFPEITEFDMDGRGGSLNDGKNLYGNQMSESTYEGARKGSSERPFVLSRAAFSGAQRFTAVWTGDNVASASHIKLSARLSVNLGLAGIPVSGADIGGFVGDTYPELFKRWIALGSFLPFFRTHTMINSLRAEPWSYGEEVEEISKAYIGLRYRMALYWYSLFKEYKESGIPPLRSLALDYWQDSNIYNPEFSDQFFLGPHLMIVPVDPESRIVKIYFPEGNWFDWYTDKEYEGGKVHFFELHPHWIPVFVKEGALIPLKKEVTQQFNLETEVIEWHLYGNRIPASATLYLDDGITLGGEEENFYLRSVKFDPSEQKITLLAPEGKYFCKFSKIIFFLHGLKNTQNAGIQADKEEEKLTNYRLVNPVSNFDPFPSDDLDTQIIFGLKTISLAHTNDKIEINID
ncbi:MAG: glycoside hydrolase family 31 [Saprospiraceae bacterium]|nr:glycoside hydrolase family 31 [Saprospiraceae bacterium]